MMEQAPVQATVACSQCGRPFAHGDLVQISGNWVCGGCKGAYLSRVMAGGPAVTTNLSYAGVGNRFAARFIDGLIFMVPFFVLAFLFFPSFLRRANGPVSLFNGTYVIAALLFSLLYEVLMLRYKQATLGKMICKLKVVRGDGSSLGWGTCFGRYFMYNIVISAVPFVNWILLITTAIMAGTDEQKRGLHDRVCDTRVVDV